MKKLLSYLLLAVMLISATLTFVACQTGGYTSGSESGGQGTVPPTPIDGLEIADVDLYFTSDKLSTMAKIKPVFPEGAQEETLTYAYDKDKINIDENGYVTIKTRRGGEVSVTATSKIYEMTFKVNVIFEQFNESIYNYSTRFLSSYQNMKQRCSTSITENTTVVFGDSFTDDWFIEGWIASYKRDGGKVKDLINAGINSTSSSHWQVMFPTLLGDVAPKNIVINLGTNDFYDLAQSVEAVTLSLQKLITFIHCKFPTTKIYLFSINQRSNISYYEQVLLANSINKAWAEDFDFLTYVDTCSVLTTAYLKSDGIHPSNGGYDLMFQTLEAAGLEYSYIN